MLQRTLVCLLLTGAVGCLDRAETATALDIPESPGNTPLPPSGPAGSDNNSPGNNGAGNSAAANTTVGGTSVSDVPSYFVLTGMNLTLAVGQGTPVTVTAYTTQGEVATNYTGVVSFTSDDNAATLSAPYTFTAADAGTHSFSSGIVVQTPGTHALSATDTTGLVGTEPNIVVTPYVVQAIYARTDSDAECALLNNRQLKCWGMNPNGSLGYGDTTLRGLSPNTMGSDLPFINVGTGRTVQEACTNGSDLNYGHTCALLDTGDVKCWGANPNGQLGYGDTQQRMQPEPNTVVPLGQSAEHIQCGFGFSCAILANGNAVCWGLNTHGTLGLGDTNARLQPAVAINFGAGRSVVDLESGSDHSCAILDNGKTACWGANSYGQLGTGDTNDRMTPAQFSPSAFGASRTVAQISPGGSFTCALLDNQQVMCWGGNAHGQLGLGDTKTRKSPSLAATFPEGVVVDNVQAGGSDYACAVSTRGSVYCWGRADNGELGLENPNAVYTPTGPVNLGTDRTAVSVTLGNYTTCAILDNETSKCWGGYYDGSLGLGVSGNLGAAPGTMGDALPMTPLW